jgi:uncharacterized protein YjiS (DUF1127 family)
METQMTRTLSAFAFNFSARNLAIRALDRLLAWQERQQEAERLRGMDDRSLRDIGLTRLDIERILRGGDPHR